MHKIVVTAIREFKSTALTPAFLIATFVIPVVFYAVMIGVLASGALEGEKKAAQGVIGVIDRTQGDVITDDIEAFFEPERQAAWRERRIEDRVTRNLAAVPEPLRTPEQETQIRSAAEKRYPPVAEVTIERLADDADEEALRQRVRDGEVLAVVILPDGIVSDPLAALQVIAPAEMRDEIINLIETGVQEAVVDERFADASVDRALVRDLSKFPAVKRVTLTEDGETSVGEAAAKIIPLASIFLLFMAIFTGSGYLLMSTVEEKSTRVMEVLLSAISPMQLMAGKILGQAFVGFTVLAIYGGFGLLAARQFDVLQLISPTTIALLAVYFVIGYFMFASLFAAIGSSVNEMREAQAMQGPVFGVAFLFIYLGIFAAMNDPNSLMTRALSFFPLALPFIMSMRVGNPSDPPPMWEIPATIAVGIISVVFMIWAAAKIFRIGVLMYGKPPNLIELAKMVRQA